MHLGCIADRISEKESNFMSRLYSHAFIFLTIIFTVYSQLVMRWQVSGAGPLPVGTLDRVQYVWLLLLNPWVMSGILATFCAGVSWMLVMTKFEISYAYPFVSLTYVIVLVASVLLFNELLTPGKVVGTILVLLGIFVISKG
jgi:drug/metabolite transporter (DMT)-like permease